MLLRAGTALSAPAAGPPHCTAVALKKHIGARREIEFPPLARRYARSLPYWTVNGKILLTPAEVVTDVSRDRGGAVELTRKVAAIVVEFTTTTLLTVTPEP